MELNLNWNPKTDKPVVVVRVSTSYWRDKRGGHIRKDIAFLKRKCKGYNILDEDMYSCGADEVLQNIVNLNDVKDGIYELITVNESTDWESGFIDSYDYKLIAYEIEKPTEA